MPTFILKKSMRFIFSLILIVAFNQINTAQSLVCDSNSRALFEQKQQFLSKDDLKGLKSSERIIAIAKSFLGTEYVAKTLDQNTENEDLVIELVGVDCTTFLEYVSALNYIYCKKDVTFDAFTEALKLFRYRNGHLDGYVSRLHYFTEWLQDNEQKGLLSIESKNLGGVSMNKPLNFMSEHIESYPQLKASTQNQELLKEVERDISPQTIHYISQEKIKSIENEIKDGDLIALSTSIKGLDVVHVGFALHQNGRLHLLHASTTGMKVEISEKPLAEMVTGNKIQNGIIVSRLKH